jgi:hypothetical protein
MHALVGSTHPLVMMSELSPTKFLIPYHLYADSAERFLLCS